MRGGASRPTASGDERFAAGRAGFGACLPQLPRGNERAPGPVNPSLLAATKELRACEPEPPCGNERAPGPANPSFRAATKRPPVSAEPEALCKVSLSDFWLLFREVGAGREGFESLRRFPPVVMLPRAGARSGCGPRSVWGPPGVPPGVAPGFTPGCRAAAGPAPRRRRRCGWLPPARAPRASRSRRAPRWTRYPWRRPPRCRNGGRPPSPTERGR